MRDAAPMNAYSKDLRMRVLAAVDRGTPREEIVRVFDVSLATVGRWLRRRRETGDVAAMPSPGRTRSICSRAEERCALWAQLEAHPEATLEEHRQLWERESGVRVSVATMSRAIRRLGWTYKQRRWEPPSGTRRPEPAGASG
jgi:transposase